MKQQIISIISRYRANIERINQTMATANVGEPFLALLRKVRDASQARIIALRAELKQLIQSGQN